MNKYKIMIVDDEPDILELLEKSLAIEGFQNITKVDNGLSAVSSCHTLHARHDYLGRYAAGN